MPVRAQMVLQSYLSRCVNILNAKVSENLCISAQSPALYLETTMGETLQE